MGAKGWIFVKLLLFQSFFISCNVEDFDFFYLVLQWPGATCDTSSGCCYPSTGKPVADFGIHGLWPNRNDGTLPENCDSDNSFDQTAILDLVDNLKEHWPTLSCPNNEGLSLWEHEWTKHGTCSESIMDQHHYFQNALNLRDQINLLQILKNAGINPDDKFYEIEEISDAIKEGRGLSPGIECNKDQENNDQLHKIYLCVDTSATQLIECPVLPSASCASKIQFAKF